MIELWDEPRLPGRFRCNETSAILQLEAPAVPSRITFLGRPWRAKREFHVTLLGSGAMERISGLEDRPVAAMRRIARRSRMAVEPGTVLRLLEQAPHATLIVECDLVGAAGFYGRIEQSLGIRIDPPPFHVTLFTSGAAKGIGVRSREEMEAFGARLTGEQEKMLAAAILAGAAPA